MARKKSSTADDTPEFRLLTEEAIEAQTDLGSFTRGSAYSHDGRIHDTVLRDATIEGLCDGSEPSPYHVWATLVVQGQTCANPRDYECTCPRSGFCKHVVALLLTWLHKPEQFVARASLADQLGGMTPEALVGLIERMIQRYPDLGLLVELAISADQDASSPASATVPTFDTATIRRQLEEAMRGIDLWEWGSPRQVGIAWQPFLELAQNQVVAKHWANAQVVFTTIIDAARAVLPQVQDDDGDIIGLVIDSDEGLSTVLDTQADLPEQDRLPAEARARLIRTLYDIWHDDVFYWGGIDLSQHGTDAIARNVIDDERAMVLDWLRNENTDEEGHFSNWKESARNGFISMLYEESGLDNDQLLDALRADNLWGDVAALLLELDEVNKAIETARLHIKDPHELLGFTTDLLQRDANEIDRAIALVDDLLWETEGKLPGNDAMLRTWLRDQFSKHNRPQDALKIAKREFDHHPTVEAYREVEKAARLPGQPEGTWDTLRSTLEASFREHGNLSTLIDIYMEEGNIRAALDTHLKQSEARRRRVGLTPAWGHNRQELDLAKAAEADYPDDAVTIYRDLAEQMIGNRQRASYKIAASYLGRAKATLKRHKRLPDWLVLIEDIRTEHKTLRALSEELDALKL